MVFEQGFFARSVRGTARSHAAVGLFDKPAVISANQAFIPIFRGEKVEFVYDAQRDVQIPPGQAAEVHGIQGLVLPCEQIHNFGTEEHQDFEPGVGKVGEGIPPAGILPVDDGREAPVPPQDVPGPVIAVQDDRLVITGKWPTWREYFEKVPFIRGDAGRIRLSSNGFGAIVLQT